MIFPAQASAMKCNGRASTIPDFCKPTSTGFNVLNLAFTRAASNQTAPGVTSSDSFSATAVPRHAAPLRSSPVFPGATWAGACLNYRRPPP
jgi:hypothetical protein